MALFIDESCVVCGACLDVCPQGAISEGIERYVIDASRCDECGWHFPRSGERIPALRHPLRFPRCIDACPEDCIVRRASEHCDDR